MFREPNIYDHLFFNGVCASGVSSGIGHFFFDCMNQFSGKKKKTEIIFSGKIIICSLPH